LRRHVPALTVVVDTPECIEHWWDIVDYITRETGLVTSEIVPAAYATAPGRVGTPARGAMAGLIRRGAEDLLVVVAAFGARDAVVVLTVT
jgi:hypothetical protein